MERRAIDSPVQLRVNEDGTKAIEGYAAVFYRAGDPGTEYQLWSDTVERIHPDAFAECMKRKDDARALFNHEASTVLGRVSAGTCTLEVDKRGLKYSIPYDDKDPDHQRVASKITRGDITGSSFAFRATKTEWSMEPGKGKKMPMDQPGREVRTVMSCEVHDVGPVTYPAYKSTTAATRAETEEAKQERDAWQEAIQQERTAAQAAIDSELSQLQARLQLINATIGD